MVSAVASKEGAGGSIVRTVAPSAVDLTVLQFNDGLRGVVTGCVRWRAAENSGGAKRRVGGIGGKITWKKAVGGEIAGVTATVEIPRIMRQNLLDQRSCRRGATNAEIIGQHRPQGHRRSRERDQDFQFVHGLSPIATRPLRSPIAFPAFKFIMPELQIKPVPPVREGGTFHVGQGKVDLIAGPTTDVIQCRPQSQGGLLQIHAELKRCAVRCRDN
jgi:hypothetical protein